MIDSNFDIHNIQGLSSRTVEEKLKNEGFNEIPSDVHHSTLQIILGVIREPMFLLLVAIGTIYLLLGDLQEALMLLSFVFIIIGITVYQERKTERALEALRDLSSPRALVVRDGEQKRVAGREVVTDDIIILSEGDRVPADAMLIWCQNLSVDESLLTGESVPVRKMYCSEDTIQYKVIMGGDDTPYVFSGTLVTSGQGVGKIRTVGINTEIGKIGKSLKTLEPEDTLLKKETTKLVKYVSIAAVVLCSAIVLIYGFTMTFQENHWLNGFLAGLTLAMAMIPEEFPVVLTIFLALGSWRISKSSVLTRRVPAVETLGAATVLCVDKTGTLTWNRMSVSKLYAAGEFYEPFLKSQNHLPETFHEIVEYSILASLKDPFDPMEKSVLKLGELTLSDTEHIHNDWMLVREYPLSQKLFALSHVWKSPDGKDYIIAAKGAPEAIFDLCHLDSTRIGELSEAVHKMADEGLRVLGVARSRFVQTELPSEQHDFHFEFVGLVGFSDPVRPTVENAVKECYEAGIRIIMITGDYPGTAKNIAGKIGLLSRENIITGPELDRMSDDELEKRIDTVNIFARVVPEQKLRIVNALKARGEIVAMTGDGVNDAPALKSAHIGIAMGERGTDVAREASSLVLLNDDFTSIVSSIRMGRRIFDNIKKAMAYILSIHVPIAGISLIPVLLRWPMVLFPVHVVFLELIIDPACSIVFEAEQEEKNVMQRPPRNPSAPLFSSKTIVLSILQGISVLLVLFGVFSFFYIRGGMTPQAELEARTLTFTSLIFANLGLILTNRSWSRTILNTLSKPNPALWWVVSGAIAFMIMTLYIPFFRSLFRFTTLNWQEILLCAAVGSLGILWFEIFKVTGKMRKREVQNKQSI